MTRISVTSFRINFPFINPIHVKTAMTVVNFLSLAKLGHSTQNRCSYTTEKVVNLTKVANNLKKIHLNSCEDCGILEKNGETFFIHT